MASSTTNSVNSLTLDLQFKRWHHRLGHLGQHTLRLVSDACNGIPFLNVEIALQESFIYIKRDVITKLLLLNLENYFKWITDSFAERNFLQLLSKEMKLDCI